MVVNLLISKSHSRVLYSLSPFNFQIILVFTTRSTISEGGFGYVPSLYEYINQGICLAKGLFFLNCLFFFFFFFFFFYVILFYLLNIFVVSFFFYILFYCFFYSFFYYFLYFLLLF